MHAFPRGLVGSLLAGAIGLTMFIGVRLFGSRYYRES